MYPLTMFLNFRRINISGSSLILNNHLTGPPFLPFYFMILLFVVIHAFLDRKLFTSEISDNFHKCPFILVIASLRVSGSPMSTEIDILHTHWILSYLCSTEIVMILVSPVAVYFPSMTGSYILGIVGLYKVSNIFSAFNTLS